jgi:hypothetical protein
MVQMRKRTLSIIVLCIAAVAARLTFGQSHPAGEATSLHTEVLEILMPMRTQPLQSRDTEWVLQIRVRERGEPEFWSRITKRYRNDGSTYSAETRQMWPRPLDQQLDQLGKPSSSARARDVASKIILRDRAIEKCPVAEKLFAQLEQQSIPVLLDDTIELDAPSYEIIGSFRGGSVAVNFRGAQAGERLRETIRQVVTSLKQCL